MARTARAISGRRSIYTKLYLITLADLICANTLDLKAPRRAEAEVNDILSGAFFTRRGLCNYVEYDLFGWLSEDIARSGMLAVAETNRLNHERRANSAAGKAELAKAERSISRILDAIEDGRRTPALMARLYDLEDRLAVLRAQHADTAPSPVGLPLRGDPIRC